MMIEKELEVATNQYICPNQVKNVKILTFVMS